MPPRGVTSHPGVPTMLTPHIVVRRAARAIDFYRRAFGAEEVLRLTGPDGAIAHAELRFGDALLYLNEESRVDDEHSPESLGGAAASLHLYVPDVDAAFTQAKGAGAKVTMPVTDMFWGDRVAEIEDPSGHRWSIATRKEDLSPKEISERAKVWFASQGKSA